MDLIKEKLNKKIKTNKIQNVFKTDMEYILKERNKKNNSRLRIKF